MRLLSALFCLVFPFFVHAQSSGKTIEQFTQGMKAQPGFVSLYYDASSGKIYGEVSQLNQEILYYTSLARGIGSNDIGLDRGKLGTEHVVKFEKMGQKLFLSEPNYAYRAISNDPLEKKAVEESFAKSVHFAFDIVAQSQTAFLIDLTPFVLRDAVQAIESISETNQGSFKIEPSRCAVFEEMTKSFPKNTEIETIITLSGTKPGRYLQAVVPTPSVVTMHQHHSFVELPDAGFKPREFDPRIGYNGIEFYDYSSPIHEPIVKKYISRHRLEKKDPTATLSEPVEPIVYYLDPGTPEPIRSALFEGATWWNQAFEYAGYRNAFQVKMLPPDADPMDIRYNLIQWVHRSTRGWSYGASIIDPRTGEILKGKVTLGSLRVRQDFLIAQGLVGNFSTADTSLSEMYQMSLDRLKQLSAHEIGHTLGLPHNYISSTKDRASVMDYPHPYVEMKNGKISLKNAYTLQIGEYDKMSILWGYQDFPKGVNEKAELEKIVQRTLAQKLVFLTDQDARPEGSVHPQTHLWDNGADAVEELQRLMNIRKTVLSQFDARKITAGTPLALLEEVFVPMYLFHRYQTEAASKVIGGADYRFALKNDGQPVYVPVNAKTQRNALDVLLTTLEPDFLAVPAQLLPLLPPRPYRYNPNQKEVFKRTTGLSFDPLSPAEAAASLTIRLLLNPERAARLATQSVYDASLPSLSEVMGKITDKIWNDKKQLEKTDYSGQIARLVAMLHVQQLMQLTQNKQTSFDVRAVAYQELKKIQVAQTNQSIGNGFSQLVQLKISQFEQNPEASIAEMPKAAPDGQPIDPGYDWLAGTCITQE